MPITAGKRRRTLMLLLAGMMLLAIGPRNPSLTTPCFAADAAGTSVQEGSKPKAPSGTIAKFWAPDPKCRLGPDRLGREGRCECDTAIKALSDICGDALRTHSVGTNTFFIGGSKTAVDSALQVLAANCARGRGEGTVTKFWAPDPKCRLGPDRSGREGTCECDTAAKALLAIYEGALSMYSIGADTFFIGGSKTAVESAEELLDENCTGGRGEGTRTEVWRLTFLKSDPAQPPGWVEALNEIYSPAGNPIIEHTPYYLLLHGPDDRVKEVEKWVILLDAPWPQVRLDVWAVQISGEKRQVSGLALEAIKLVSEAQEDMAWVQHMLSEIVREHWRPPRYAEPTGAWEEPEVQQSLRDIGFDPDPNRPLALHEALIFVALSGKSEQIIRKLDERLHEYLPEEKRCAKPIAHSRRQLDKSLHEHLAEEKGCAKPIVYFRRLGRAYEVGMPGQNREQRAKDVCIEKRCITEFASAWKDGKHRRARMWAAMVDATVESKLDAYAQDLQEALMLPLLDDLMDLAGDGRSECVSLVGKTRLVVTSGLPVTLAPKTKSYVETTRRKSLTLDSLTQMLDKATDEEGVLATALPTASPLELVAVGQLLSPPEPTFTEIAPGINIKLTPTAFPSCGEVRLKVDASFGARVTPLKPDQDSSYVGFIESHEVKTDAAVKGFDLFEISSFSIKTSYPRPPWVFPVLGQLPLVGRLFQLPRSDETRRHESIILVNAVIVPRTLDLARLLYGAAAGQAGGPANSRSQQTAGVGRP